MKNKISIFSFALILVVAVFAACQKETPTTPTSTINTEVKERGVCTVTITAFDCSVFVCGTQNNNVPCTAFIPTNFGNDYIKNGYSFTYTLATPTEINAAIDYSDTWGANPRIVVTSGNQTVTYLLIDPNVPPDAGNEVVVKINDFCTLN
jgi:hypothetical protein